MNVVDKSSVPCIFMGYVESDSWSADIIMAWNIEYLYLFGLLYCSCLEIFGNTVDEFEEGISISKKRKAYFVSEEAWSLKISFVFLNNSW